MDKRTGKKKKKARKPDVQEPDVPEQKSRVILPKQKVIPRK